MTQNIYDDPEFFESYSRLGRSVEGLDVAAEWPALKALLWGAGRTRGAESTNRTDHRNRSQQGSAVSRKQGRQRRPQSTASEGGRPKEDSATKEIRGAQVNVLSGVFCREEVEPLHVSDD